MNCLLTFVNILYLKVFSVISFFGLHVGSVSYGLPLFHRFLIFLLEVVQISEITAIFCFVLEISVKR